MFFQHECQPPSEAEPQPNELSSASPLGGSLSSGFQVPFPALSPIFNSQEVLFQNLAQTCPLRGCLSPFVFSVLLTHSLTCTPLFSKRWIRGCECWGSVSHRTLKSSPHSGTASVISRRHDSSFFPPERACTDGCIAQVAKWM